MHALLCCVALMAVHDETYLSWVSEAVSETSLPATTGERLSSEQLAELERGKPVLPFGDLTAGVRAGTAACGSDPSTA